MNPLKALVVDDEPLARERLSRLLQEAGCTVVDQLEDGVALLQWLKEGHDVDVIFLDIQMPGLNGMEALAEAVSYPPVVFVTAYSEYAVRAFELAAHDYLLQAFPEEGLMRIQRHLLVRPRAVIGIRPEGIGKMKIRVAQGVELSVSRTMTPRLREVLRGTGSSS